MTNVGGDGWVPACIVSTRGTAETFLQACCIWLRKPHVVNRRLCGAQPLWEGQCGDRHVQDVLRDIRLSAQRHLLASDLCRQLDTTFGGRVPASEPCAGHSPITAHCPPTQAHQQTLQLYLRDLIPKSIDKFPTLRELVVIDRNNATASFIPLQHINPDKTTTAYEADLGYQLEHQGPESSIALSVRGAAAQYQPGNTLGYTDTWLADTLLHKLARWSEEAALNTEVTSLKLVSLERYNELYQELKVKYGLPLVQIWPETTDPQKFVFEDVAIASYLLVLWEEERRQKKLCQKQSFVDLGCGNGLLVYILASEGHRGLGLDVRRRKIWDWYGPKFNLKEEAIQPTGDQLFPGYDWLIGNHSDELTPWLPVIASRSAPDCRFFVLPCCPWDFFAKFNKKTAGLSQYRTYLNYVREVGQVCGFSVEEDTLRIPSTKRVCFIGQKRAYPEGQSVVRSRMQAYIDSRPRPPPTPEQRPPDQRPPPASPLDPSGRDTAAHQGTGGGALAQHSASHFLPRSAVVTTRNCVSMARDVKDNMAAKVFWKLLEQDGGVLELPQGRTWRKGGSVPLVELVGLFDADTLQLLKNQCGGLQTLLRNYHYVFKVQGGAVELRDWASDVYLQRRFNPKRGKPKSKKEAAVQTKKRLCYMNMHHPDGCPLPAESCRFAHGEEDLRVAC